MSDDAAEFSTEIAVIGAGLRVPGARDLTELWEIVSAGRETILPFSEQTLLARGIAPELLRHPHYVKAGGALPDLELFDAGYFGLMPAEARMLDPQHRLFLECVKAALEDAGIDPRQCPGEMGVFAGAGRSAYLINNLLGNSDYRRGADPFQVWSSNQNDFLPTRTSYLFGLTGPSVNVQTACSTSLACVHYACQSLLAGECSVALAGAAAVSSAHGDGYLYQPGGTLSPDGHCRPFSAAAQGTVMASGAGVVVLKKLAAARRAGDRILGIIKGSALKNDGAERSSFGTPSLVGQVAVITEALQVAGVEPSSIGYVESSALGTPLGDSIEIAALTQAYRAQTEANGFCAVGSIKANVGHLDAASGILGLLKCLLCLQHGEWPPMANFERPNPAIDFGRTPFLVNATRQPWPEAQVARRAAVSSFALGGTNVHVILEEPDPEGPRPTVARAWPLFVSARTPAALETLLDDFAGALAKRDDDEWAAFCFTSLAGRKRERHHACLVARDRAAAVRVLGRAREQLARGRRSPAPLPVIFFFPDRLHLPELARELYEDEPAFRAAVDAVATAVRSQGGGELLPRLWDVAPAPRRSQDLVTFTVEFALTRLWQAWGVTPAHRLGRGVGEWAAACTAGAMPLDTAIRLLSWRETLLPAAPAAVLTVELSAPSLQPLLGPRLRLIEIGGEAECAVAGPPDELATLNDRLLLNAVKTRWATDRTLFLPDATGPAFDRFVRAVRAAGLPPPDGRWLTSLGHDTPDDYWIRQLTAPVDLAAGQRRLAPNRGGLGVVLGAVPDWVRGPDAGEQPEAHGSLASTAAASRDVILATACALHAAGHALAWDVVFGPAARRTTIPGHPLVRKRYWVDPGEKHPPSPVDIGTRCRVSSWRRDIASVETPDPSDPKPVWVVFGRAAAYLEPFRAHAAADVVTVIPGAGFRRRKRGDYTVGAGSAGDLERLFRAVTAAHGAVARVWYLHPAEQGVGRHAQASAGGVSAVAAALRTAADTATLEVVTRGLQDVQGDELALPADTALLLELAAAGERWPQLRWHLHDLWLPPFPTFPDVRAALERAQAESRRPVRPRITAIRGTHVWTAGYEPWRAEPAEARSTAVVPGGHYLFNGALDDVGWHFLAQVADAGAGTLVLAGTGLPAREQWDDGLWPEQRRRWGTRIAALQKLVDRGIAIEIREHLFDSRSHRRRRAPANASGRRFDGVYHAVGLGTATGCSAAGLERLATDWLSLLGGRPRWLLFGVVVPPRPEHEGEKALLHLFVESFGRVLAKREGFAVHTFAWDQLAAANPGAAVATAETAALVHRLLGAGVTDAVVERPNAAFARADADAADPGDLPTASEDFVPPETAEEVTIAEIWSRHLGSGRVGLNDRLFALGGNSLMALACARQIAERCELPDLPVARLATDTVRELAAYCVSSRRLAAATVP